MSARAIYKYRFEISDDVRIELPAGAEVLHAEMQHGEPTLWVKVNPKAVKIVRFFRVVGTGQLFDDDRLTHVATFQQPPFVWHMFEASV